MTHIYATMARAAPGQSVTPGATDVPNWRRERGVSSCF
jgi:hypothetical protein